LFSFEEAGRIHLWNTIFSSTGLLLILFFNSNSVPFPAIFYCVNIYILMHCGCDSFCCSLFSKIAYANNIIFVLSIFDLFYFLKFSCNRKMNQKVRKKCHWMQFKRTCHCEATVEKLSLFIDVMNHFYSAQNCCVKMQNCI
jgi:hypothetical protein